MRLTQFLLGCILFSSAGCFQNPGTERDEPGAAIPAEHETEATVAGRREALRDLEDGTPKYYTIGYVLQNDPGPHIDSRFGLPYRNLGGVLKDETRDRRDPYNKPSPNWIPHHGLPKNLL